jgi:hypothetical protein
MFLFSFFRGIASAIAKIFKGINKEKVQSVLTTVHNLLKQAIPVVEMIAALTPTPTDDTIIAALKNLNWTAESIINQVDEVKKDGQRLALATEVLKEHLLGIIAKGGKIDIGDELLTTSEQILKLDKNILRSAIQNGYTLWKLGNKK